MTSPDFNVVAEVLDRCGLEYSDPEADHEGAEYAAWALVIEGRRAHFRVAKTTPVKAGAFVTLWLRSAAGHIRPVDASDDIDVVVVAIEDSHGSGQFVFPSHELQTRGIFSRDGEGGKRAFRVYAPWLHGLNPQATRTQRWQARFFLETRPDGCCDPDAAQALCG